MASQIGHDIDLTAVAELGDALLFQLSDAREAGPIHWSKSVGAWMIMRHADIYDALRGYYPLSAERFTPEGVEPLLGGAWQKHIPMLGRFVPRWITNVDGAQHMRMRILASKSFGRPVVESVRPYVQSRVKALLDLVAAKRDVEFVEEVARELPGRTILRLMGLPEDLYPKLRHWATTMTLALGSGAPTKASLMTAEAVLVDMTQVFVDVLAQRRSSGRDENDFIRLLLNATDEGNKLSEDEMIGLLQLVVFAGHDTTSNSMALGVAGLSQHPDQWAHMRAHPENIGNAVAEIMRLTAMSTAQHRIATDDFEWHGHQIAKGDIVFLMIAAGNRDPRLFDRPDDLDVTRNTMSTLVFGPGLHHCIGHLLAKMQLGEFFGALVERFDGAEMLDPALRFLPPLVFRGLDSLRIRFDPRTS